MILQGNKAVRHGSLVVAGAAVVCLALMPVAAQAQEGPNQGKVSASAGVDVTNAYFYRGLFQENQGVIVQPWMDLTLAINDTTSLTFGIWNSFHDAQTGATANGTGPDPWYEADLYITLSKTLTDTLEGSVTYTSYTSPNDAFATINEFALGLAIDDSEIWGDTLPGGLQPAFTVAFESDGSALGPDEGIYFEFAIEPSCTLIESADYPVTLSIPFTLGLSLTDYYGGATNDPNFGFFQVGAVVSMPISCIPADYGAWEASLGVHLLYLSENTELLNDDQDDTEIIINFGISMGY